jgi:sugar phosphate permease
LYEIKRAAGLVPAVWTVHTAGTSSAARFADSFHSQRGEIDYNRDRAQNDTGSLLIGGGGRMADNLSGQGNGFAGRLRSLLSPSAASTVGERTRRRVTLHLIPFLFCLYILAYLDRVNISVAALSMQDPPEDGGLGFTEGVTGFGFGVFFWGYWILEIPSTVSVTRWGARWVFARILILWGICAALTGAIGTPIAASLFQWIPTLPEPGGFWQWVGASTHFVNNLHESAKYQLYFFRFLLGFFEGGFFPSVIVYLSLWFRPEDRAKAVASFMSAIPLSSMLGMPLSGLLLNVNWFGVAGWRWIFLIQGAAPIVAGVVTFFVLPDWPQKVKWLAEDERDWLLGELEREKKSKLGHGHLSWKNVGLVLLLTGVYFCLNVSSYGLATFMPAIMKEKSGLSKTWASVLAGVFYVPAMIGMLINGWHSDRTKERLWHVATPLTLLSAGIWLAAFVDRMAVVPVIVMILCVGTFMYAHLPAFWPIPSMFLGMVAAASSIGFINMIGNLGGSVGPTMVGNVREGQTSFAPSLMLLAPWPMIAAMVILIMGYIRRRYPAPSDRAQGAVVSDEAKAASTV